MRHSSTLVFRAVLAAMLLSTVLSSRSWAQKDSTVFGWSERKLTAVVLSTVIPGSGQSYLGYSTKGAVLTIGAFGSGLITILAQNNVVGRNERLGELKALYQQSVTWETSNLLWLQMLETKDLLDKDVRHRDLFLKVTVAFWVASVVDAVFFSEDQGTQTFGSTSTMRRPSISMVKSENGEIRTTFSYRF